MNDTDSERYAAASQLAAVRRAAAAAQSAGYNNGITLIVWGTVVALTFTLIDILGPTPGAIGCIPVAGGAALWTRWYQKHRPVQTGCVATRRVVKVWAVYYTLCLFAMVQTVHRHFHEAPPTGFFTAFGLVSAAPLVFGGWRMRRALTRSETRNVDSR
jgi:hypothetical protein